MRAKVSFPFTFFSLLPLFVLEPHASPEELAFEELVFEELAFGDL